MSVYLPQVTDASLQGRGEVRVSIADRKASLFLNCLEVFLSKAMAL